MALLGKTLSQQGFRVEYEPDYRAAGIIEDNSGYLLYGIAELDSVVGYIRAIDPNGEERWKQEYSFGSYTSIVDLTPTSYGFLAVGNVVDSLEWTYLFRLDFQGNVIDKVRQGIESLTLYDNSIGGIIRLDDNLFAVAQSNIDVLWFNTDAFIFFVDEFGTKIDSVYFNFPISDDWMVRILPKIDGGVLALMESRDQSTGYTRFSIISMDKQGTLEWRTEIDASDPILVRGDIVELENASIVVVMETTDMPGGSPRTTILRYDSSGSFISETIHGYFSVDQFNGARPSVVVNSQNRNTITILSVGSDSSTADYPTLFLDFFDSGDSLVERVKFFSVEPLVASDGGKLIATKDFGYCIANNNFHWTGFNDRSEVIKIDCIGEVANADYCGFTDTQEDILVYPNPSNDRTAIQLSNIDVESEIYCQVYSSSGKLVRTIKQQGNRIVELRTGDLSPGLYLLSIWVDGESYGQEKLIVSKE